MVSTIVKRVEMRPSTELQSSSQQKLGVPWVQIMGNEFESVVDGRGLGGYLSEEFVKNS